jgi:D-alanyl-D-alanine carboxypeptidase
MPLEMRSVIWIVISKLISEQKSSQLSSPNVARASGEVVVDGTPAPSDPMSLPPTSRTWKGITSAVYTHANCHQFLGYETSRNFFTSLEVNIVQNFPRNFLSLCDLFS